MPNARIPQRFVKFVHMGGGNGSRISETCCTRAGARSRAGVLPEVAEVERLAVQPQRPAKVAA